MSEKTQITVSGIQADLNNGLTRVEIQAKYSLSGRDMKTLFAHPKLKGLKTKPAPSFELIDDTEDVVENAVEEVITEDTPDPVVDHTPNVDNDFSTEPISVSDEF